MRGGFVRWYLVLSMLVSLAGRSVHAEDYSVFLDLHFGIGGVHGSFDRGGSEIDLGGWNTSVGALLYFLSPTGSDNYLGIGVGALYSSDISDWDLSPDVNEIRFTCLKLPVLAAIFMPERKRTGTLPVVHTPVSSTPAVSIPNPDQPCIMRMTNSEPDSDCGPSSGSVSSFPGWAPVLAGVSGWRWILPDRSRRVMTACRPGSSASVCPCRFFCRGRASFSGQALAGEPWIPGAFCVSGARVRCWQTGRQAIAGPAVHPLIARSSSKQFLHRCEWPSVRWIFRTDTGIDSSYPF